MVCEIPLTRGKTAIISKEDYERVSQFKWYYDPKGYAANGRFYLHRFLTGCPEKPLLVDHINRNRLDNRRENLRVVTPSENSKNRDPSWVQKRRETLARA